MPSPGHSIRRPSAPRIPRAIPVQESAPKRTGKPEVRRALPVEQGWAPKAGRATRAAAAPTASGADGTEKKQGWLARIFKPAPRTAAPARGTPGDGSPVKSYGKYQSHSQLDYASERLGNGNKTIASHGCFLTSMTIASTGLTGKKVNPSEANRIVRAGDGFSGGALEDGRAAKALGMKLADRRAMTNGNAASMRTKLDGWLASGKPAVAGVDLHEGRSTGTSGSDADHFIVIVDKNKNGTYTALDPLGGRKITLEVNDAGRLVTNRVVAGSRPYRVDELAFLQVR